MRANSEPRFAPCVCRLTTGLMSWLAVHPKVVQERLGHAQISLTLDTYSHVLPAMHKEAAGRLDSLLVAALPDENGSKMAVKTG
jgi:integrase